MQTDVSLIEALKKAPALITQLVNIRKDRGLMLQTAQIRAARALLGGNQDDLAKAAKVSIATIRRIEGQEGPVMGYVSTLMSIQSAFEQVGIHFLDNDCVSAWNKDPVFGVIGIQSGPRGLRVHSGF